MDALLSGQQPAQLAIDVSAGIGYILDCWSAMDGMRYVALCFVTYSPPTAMQYRAGVGYILKCWTALDGTLPGSLVQCRPALEGQTLRLAKRSSPPRSPGVGLPCVEGTTSEVLLWIIVDRQGNGVVPVMGRQGGAEATGRR